MRQGINPTEMELNEAQRRVNEVHPGLNAASRALSPAGLAVWFILSIPLAVSALQGLPESDALETLSGKLLGVSALISAFAAGLLLIANFLKKSGARNLLLAVTTLGAFVLVFVDISAAVSMPQQEMETAVLQSFRVGVVLHVLLLMVSGLHWAAQSCFDEG